MIRAPKVPGLATVLGAPLRIASAGLHAAAATTAVVAGLAGSAALVGGSAAARTGGAVLDVVPGARSALRAVGGVALEAVGGPPARRSSRHGRRHWIEVCGLSGPDADAIADEVLDSVRAVPGVIDAVINRSVARVVVTVGPECQQQSLPGVVADAERRARNRAAQPHRPLTLPGDDTLLLARAFGAAAAAVGLGLSLAGATMKLPGLPNAVSVLPTLAEQVPAIRHQLVHKLGNEGTDLLLTVLSAAANVLTISPTAAAAEAATRALLVDEAWTVRQAWRRHEPDLAGAGPAGHGPARGTTVFADGPGEEYANDAGWIGLAAAAVIGVLSRSPTIAGAAALVAAPKPSRAAREAFGCAVTRGLSTRHDTVIVRPRSLRALDRVDAVVIDPRALYTDELMVTRVRGVPNARRTSAWQAAQAALEAGLIGPGWHRFSSIPAADGPGEALVSPLRDPFATAVISAARRTGARVESVGDDGLRSLRQGFDRLHPASGSLDDSLADLVSALRLDGATVLFLTTSEMAAQHEADITIGITRRNGPPWGADMFVPDLPAAWRILRAIPAARAASSQGIRLSLSSSAIGALMLIPGVPGYGPDAVNTSVFAGLWTGFRAGNKVFDEPLPTPEPGHEWHGLTADEVRRLLPRPPSVPEPPHQAGPSLLVAPARFARAAGAQVWSLAGDLAGEFRANLADPITPILATGAIASALLGSPLDAALVSSVLLANAALSAQQQLHAQRTLRRLLAVQDPPARRRVGPLGDRRSDDVPATALRPGDIIEVRAGEVVPADARLIEAVNVEIDESRLTGESLPVPKQIDPTPGAPLAERACMVYAGCTVVAGTGIAIVTAVGNGTEVMRAIAMTPKTTRRIGLHYQLARITSRALPWTLGGGALVGLLSVLRGSPLRAAVGSAVAVSVAAVPEGLPLVATLAQLAAARKLSNRHVLIRNPNSVEALARLDVVCFDKTGTLSENRPRVKRVHSLPGHSRNAVIAAAARTIVAHDGKADHATDEAIRQAAGDISTPEQATEPRIYLPFQSGRPFAASLTGTRLTIKGAPEVLSAALADNSHDLVPIITRLATEGLRVLVVAERTLTARQAARAAADPAAMERFCRAGLKPIGLLGLADTPRATAASLLAQLGDRGIGVRLITGDHPITAAVIANDLGLAVTEDQVITGTEWEAMSADERAAAVAESRVFARMSPEHKIDVVQALERAGLVTAMVGDGANDAAAIRAASVGIAVAAGGSDPARGAADMLLLDGHIEALLAALDEGDQLWRRVQSAVSVLLGGNAGEVMFALLTAVLTGRSVLNARQMLLVNMLTDALPAAALAVSSQDGARTLDRDEAAMWRAIAVRGTATTAGATLAWAMGRLTGPQRRAATIALIGLVCTQLTQTVADSRSPLVVSTAAGSFLALAAVISTPGVSQLFGCTPIDPLGWGQAFLATGVASLLSKYAPALLERLLPFPDPSVTDGDDAGHYQDGVDLPDDRSEQSRPEVDKNVSSGEAGFIGHQPRTDRSGDLSASDE